MLYVYYPFTVWLNARHCYSSTDLNQQWQHSQHCIIYTVIRQKQCQFKSDLYNTTDYKWLLIYTYKTNFACFNVISIRVTNIIFSTDCSGFFSTVKLEALNFINMAHINTQKHTSRHQGIITVQNILNQIIKDNKAIFSQVLLLP